MNEDINPELAKRFPKGERTKRCEDLMRPDVRELLNLPLDQKIVKSKQIIKEALEKYPKTGLGFSGGTDSLVLLHLAKDIIPKDFPIIFVNTQHQFPETYDFIRKIIADWGFTNYIEVKADQDRVEEFIEKFGAKTPEFTAICCEFHKIMPLVNAIGDLGLNAFIAGIRGVEHEERAKETIFSPRQTHDRVHPILFWSQNDALDYVRMFNIECNPLYAQGYTSLGCMECTEKNADPNAHERAGRGVVREEIMERLRELGYT